MEETIEYKGFEIEIIQDSDPINPLTEFDSLGTIVYKHSRYTLGHEEITDPIGWLLGELGRELKPTESYCTQTIKELEAELREKAVLINLYLLDHSGLTIKTVPFGGMYGRFDSCQFGYCYCDLDKAHKNLILDDSADWDTQMDDRRDRGSKITLREATERILKSEVDLLNDYVSGNVYGYNIEELGESCWGYFGDPEKSCLLDDAKEIIDYHLSQKD